MRGRRTLGRLRSRGGKGGADEGDEAGNLGEFHFGDFLQSKGMQIEWLVVVGRKLKSPSGETVLIYTVPSSAHSLPSSDDMLDRYEKDHPLLLEEAGLAPPQKFLDRFRSDTQSRYAVASV